MSKKRTQSEKLFSHQELNQLLKKMNSLELMEIIDKSYGLGKILNNRFHKQTGKAIKKLTGK